MNKDTVIKHLYYAYYAMLILAIVVATLMFYLLKHDFNAIDRQSTAGITLQYFVIFYVVLSVPGMLFWFKKECDKIKLIKDENEQYTAYQKRALLRIIIIGFGVSFGILAFYLLGGYTSMLWCAAISAIGLIFTKPNKRKMELELLNENPE